MCCGCRTCAIVCPADSISFKADVIGFFYARVDENKCINCGKCRLVCPIQKEFPINKIGIEAHVAYSNNTDVRYRGSSGGLFETIAAWIVHQGGTVFASRFDENLRLKIVSVDTLEGVRSLTKSKYLQSECSNVFMDIRNMIQSKKPTLFCSTPCQVAACREYLGPLAEQENAFFMDFFCHGVPSQQMFDKCRSYVERKEHIHITGFEFRTKKKHGATPHYYTLRYYKNGRMHTRTALYLKDPFYLGFQKYLTLRDCCYHCPYGSGNHRGDITVGDFHDVDKYIQGLNRFDGVSLVIINTAKGCHIWESVQNELAQYDVPIETLYADRQIYSGGTQEPSNRSAYINDAETLNPSELIEKWFNPTYEWKKEVYYSFPYFIRKQIKRIASRYLKV